jgi:hypothetical protein
VVACRSAVAASTLISISPQLADVTFPASGVHGHLWEKRNISWLNMQIWRFPVNRYYEFLQDPGRKQSAELILNFMQTTRQLSQNADMLFDDGKIVVFKIKK